MKPLLWLLTAVWFAGTTTAHAQKAEMPRPASFSVGDTWEWSQFDSRSKVEIRKRQLTVVNVDGILMFHDGKGNLPLSQPFVGGPATKSWRVWPLEVGKKWVAEEDWVNSRGDSGNQKVDAEVIAYEEVTVPAGKFMAFKIEYRGWWNNLSRGLSGQQSDTYWYAPEASADVKHVRDDGWNMDTRELISFKRAVPSQGAGGAVRQ